MQGITGCRCNCVSHLASPVQDFSSFQKPLVQTTAHRLPTGANNLLTGWERVSAGPSRHPLCLQMCCPTHAESPGAETTLKDKWRALQWEHGKGEKERCASCPQIPPRVSWKIWNWTENWEVWAGGRGWLYGAVQGMGQEEKAAKSKQASRGNTLHITWNILGPKPLLLGLYLLVYSWILAVCSAVTWHKNIADRHNCFPVGRRGRKLCLITHKIQPEMLAARGTNDSLQKNAWIQSSKHALTEECCLELPRMAVQQ